MPHVRNAQHRHGRPVPPRGAPKDHVDLLTESLDEVILGVPGERIATAPSRSAVAKCAFLSALKQRRMPTAVLCRAFDSCGQCPRGSQCPFFHVSSAGLPRRHVHVNFRVRAPCESKYDAMAPGAFLCVYGPNRREPLDIVPSECLVATAGAKNALGKSPADSGEHCAHFYFNGLCNRAHDCQFVHVMHVDPHVALSNVEFAPIPAIVGPRKSDIHPTPTLCSGRVMSSCGPSSTESSASSDDDRGDLRDSRLHQEAAVHCNSSRIYVYGDGGRVPLFYRHNPYNRAQVHGLIWA